MSRDLICKMKKLLILCVAALLLAGSVISLSGCGSKEDTQEAEDEDDDDKDDKDSGSGKSSKGKKTVGEDIKIDEITEFYYTVENINYDAYYQRYYFYTKDGGYYFYHESRERKDDYGPTTEEDITASGTVELSEDQWKEFFDLICDGTVKKRTESTETGGEGPWLYLYWEGDKGKYQEYSFDSHKDLKTFKEYCISLAGVNPDEDGDDIDYSSMSPREALETYAGSLEYLKGTSMTYETAVEDYRLKTDISIFPSGYLDYLITDYDHDGQDEMLLAEIKKDEPIRITMYEFDGHSVYDAAIYECDPMDYDTEYNSTYVFIYEFDDTIIIGAASDGGAGYVADGTFYDVRLLTYYNSAFIEETYASYAGSDMLDENGFARTLRSYGINCTLEDYDLERVLQVTHGTQLFNITEHTTGEKTHKDENGWDVYDTLYKEVTYNGHASCADLGLEDAYILPYSSEYYLYEGDLEGLSNEELRRARNEIVARHGRKFDDEELQAYFDAQSWYHGTIEPEDFNKKVTLSDVEIANMDLIKSLEK